MHDDAYRLWQHWQQMHYPRRGLPADESLQGACDAGWHGRDGPRPILPSATRAKTLDAAARATLRRCSAELGLGQLSADASRYFGRLRRLSDLVVAEGVPAESSQSTFHCEPLGPKDSA